MAETWSNIPVRLAETTRPAATRESLAHDEDDWMYRRLSGQDRVGDLDHTTRARFQRLARWLYHSNPLARRVCDLPVDYLLGGGVGFQTTIEGAAGEALKGAIERFWEHPQNRFAERLPLWFTEYSEVFGELFLPAFINRQSGDVALGYLAPEQINEVWWNPDNALEATAAVQLPVEPGGKPVFWSVIRGQPGDGAASYPPHPDLAAGAERFRQAPDFDPERHEWGGALFYFRANGLATGRGRSALEPMLDWVHAYDQFLFGDLRNANLQGAFVWDVECEGLDGAALQRKADEIRKNPPRPGEVRVHNSSEKWQAITPRLHGEDHAGLGTQVKRVIGIGAGLPSHLVGAEDDVNRATAESSSLPFLRRMERRQERLRDLIETLVDYQLDQRGHVHGTRSGLPGRPYAYETVLPEVCVEDGLHAADCLAKLADGLGAAVRNGFLSKDEARRIWRVRGGVSE